MSEPPTNANPDRPTPDDDAVTDPLALTLGAGVEEPIELPEPVLGSDEDGAPDFGAPDAGAAERPPFLGAARDEAADAADALDPPAAADASPDAATDEAAAEAPPPAPVETAVSRRVWRQLRYAAITQEKPVVVVPPPVIDDQGRLIRKYLFEKSFDPVDAPPEPEDTEPDPEELVAALPPEPVELVVEEPPPPTFSEAELAAARAAGYTEGEETGRMAASQAIEVRLAELVQQIGAIVPGLAADRDQAIAAVSQEAARLAHAMVRKIMPELARRYRIDEIEAVVIDSLSKALDQPRIIIRTPADVTTFLSDRLETVARQYGFAGRVIVLGDPSLGPSDVKVEWGDGGAERCIQRAWADVEAVVARVVDRLEQVAPVSPVPSGATEDTIGSAA
jgi:flagellar assembly protein FliH